MCDRVWKAIVGRRLMLEFGSKRRLSATERTERREFAAASAKAAGRLALPWFRQPTKVDNKASAGSFDPVTEADKAVEAALRQAISLAYPRDGLFGEEYGYEVGESGFTWVIDPIDGTRSFMSGFLHWGVLLALFDGQDPVVGVLYQPYTDELFVGDGDMAELRRADERRLLRVAGDKSVYDCTLASTGPQFFAGAERQAAFGRVVEAAKQTRYGGDCYLYAMLAMGYVELSVESNLNAYDIQALIPIIRGAGGVIETWSGGNPALGGDVVAAATKELLVDVQQLLADS